MAQNDMINKAEDVADQVLRHTKNFLPHIGRFCLVSTFVEDGIRMWMQWGEQRDYIASTWGCSAFIASMFVLINMVGQIAACIGILTRKQVPVMCGLLFFIIGLQTIAYSILWDIKFLARNLALVGAVILLLAESKSENRSLFAGVPTLDQNTPKSYMQLSGRVLLVLMFITLLHFNFNPLDMTFHAIGLICIMSIAVGFHARLAALFLTIGLMTINIKFNRFWAYDSIARDFMKFDFFQTLSVVGGLILVIQGGAGDFSYDEYKKKS